MEDHRRRSCYLKCGSCTSRAISPKSLLKWKVSDLLIKSLRFNKLSRWFICTLKFNVHWSRSKPKGDRDIKTFPFWAYLGIYTRTKKIRFWKSYYNSGPDDEKYISVPSTYCRYLANVHRLSRKIDSHVIASYIQYFNLDLVSFGEDWKSFLNKIKDNWQWGLQFVWNIPYPEA